MNIEDITDIDYQILAYIAKNEPVAIETLYSHFSAVASLEYRLKILATPEYQMAPLGMKIPIENTSCIFTKNQEVSSDPHSSAKPRTKMYHLTNLGKKALQDYQLNSRRSQKELWLKNAWIPILVSLATNLLLDGLKWLFPLLQGWLASILG